MCPPALATCNTRTALPALALPPFLSFIDAVGEDVATHQHVDSSSLVAPMADVPLQLYHLLSKHMAAEPDYKVRRRQVLRSRAQAATLPNIPVWFIHTACSCTHVTHARHALL